MIAQAAVRLPKFHCLPVGQQKLAVRTELKLVDSMNLLEGRSGGDIPESEARLRNRFALD